MNENQLQALLEAVRTLQDLGKVAYFNKGAYNSETTYEINDVVSYNGSSYVSLVNENRGNLPTNIAFWSVVASKGEKGDTGKAFVIEKTYATIEDMVDDYDNMNINDYVMIQGSIEDEENATLWTKTDTEVSPYKWVYLADFSGASGITGATPNIQIGTVTEGNQPSVTRRAGSTNENPILDFVLKTGATGATGATGNGISGVAKTSTSGLVDTYTISYTSGNSSTFDVHNGKGISNIAKTSSVGLVDTYTITYNDGTTSTFEITNGEDGEVTQEQLDETNEEVERAEMVYNALPKVSGEGTDLKLDNTAECPVYDIELKGNTYQKTTTGKNLFNISDVNSSISNVYFKEISTDYTLTADTTYTLSLDAQVQLTPFIMSVGCGVSSYSKEILVKQNQTNGRIYITFTPTTEQLENGNKLFIRCPRYASLTSTTFELKNFQLETSSSMTDYEPYTGGQPSPSPDYPQQIHKVSGDNTITISNSDDTKEQNFPITLGDLEYCKIEDYEDVFFKNVVGSEYYDSTLELDKWYLKNNVRKVVFNGSETITYSSTYKEFAIAKSDLNAITNATNVRCNYFAHESNQDFRIRIGNTPNLIWLFDYNDYFNGDLTDFKTWLSTHNTEVYYQLATPTYTLLNNTLQTQLDNIQKAISYLGQTNVSQTNNDLPFVIKMSAIRDLSGIFDLISQSEEI